jgi:hypothetical protein
LDIVERLTVDVVVQFLNLWMLVRQVQVVEWASDSFEWEFSVDGCSSTRSTYDTCFVGRTTQPGAMQVWNWFAPFKFKMFGWLAQLGRCCTTDCLECCGLDNHGMFPLYEMHRETLNHLLL